MLNRRQFLAYASSTNAAIAFNLFPNQEVWAEGTDAPKTVAFLGTEVRRHSHAQHFLDRLTEGYAWGGAWQRPRVKVASVFIDQIPEGDLSTRTSAVAMIGEPDWIEVSGIDPKRLLQGENVLAVAVHQHFTLFQKSDDAVMYIGRENVLCFFSYPFLRLFRAQ